MLLFLPKIPRCSKKPSYSLILAEFRLYNILQESVNKSMDFIEPGSMTVLKRLRFYPESPLLFFPTLTLPRSGTRVCSQICFTRPPFGKLQK